MSVAEQLPTPIESQLLTVRDLRLRYGSQLILDGVDFHLARGEALALVGESGSGKTSTALSTIQLLAPSARLSGSIIYRSARSGKAQELIDLPETQLQMLRGREIGMIFQDALAALNPVRSIGSQLCEVLRVHQRLSRMQAKSAALEWLARVGLHPPEQLLARYPHELSGGQRQRALIAMALACEPALLICDEPTSSLDVTVQKQIITLLQSLRAEVGLSLLFISHDLALTAELCERIAVMRAGKIVEMGRSMAVFSAPSHCYTRGLLACRPSLHRNPERLLTVADFERGLAQTSARDLPARTAFLQQAPEFLQVKNLSASYPARGLAAYFKAPTVAVQPLSFAIKRGECLGIVGESGSGKTTLARALVRLHPQCSGEVWLSDATGGSPIDLLKPQGAALRRLRQRFQMVFQDPYSSLNPALSIQQCLHEPLAVHGLHNDRREQRVHELLDAVALPRSSLLRKPVEFSGGQRQRIAIARALAVEPELLICDESVSALDVSVQAQILNLLKDLQASFRLTLIFISHDLSVIRFLADQVIVMAGGAAVEQGLSESIYQHPQHEVTKALLEAVPKGLPAWA